MFQVRDIYIWNTKLTFWLSFTHAHYLALVYTHTLFVFRLYTHSWCLVSTMYKNVLRVEGLSEHERLPTN